MYHKYTRSLLVLGIVVFLNSTASLRAEVPEQATQGGAAWKNFRGPGGQGHAASDALPSRWSEVENVDWKTKIPGTGYSAPVIDGDRVWLTTAFHQESSPEEVTRRTVDNTGSEPITVSDYATMKAICVDLKQKEKNCGHPVVSFPPKRHLKATGS